MAEGTKVLELRQEANQENISDYKQLLNELIELKSLLNNPSPTSESLTRAEKFAGSCLDSPHLQEVSSDPEFKDFPVLSMIHTIDVYRKDEKDFNVFLRFFNHVLYVYMKDDAFQLPQTVTESLVQLANSFYGEKTKDENVTSLYLLSCVYFIREPTSRTQPQEGTASAKLTSCTELYFSYTEHTPHNLCLILSVLTEFVIYLPILFSDHGGFDYLPFLLPILECSTNNTSVCLATFKLLEHAFLCNPNIKQDPNFTTLPTLLSTFLETYPRDVDVVKQVVTLIVNLIADQKGLVSLLTAPTSPIVTFCTNSLQDDICPLAIQFSVCSLFIVLTMSVEQTAPMVRLVLKCINRAKTENQEIPEYVFSGVEGLTLHCSIDKLTKDPTDELSPPPSHLTYSEFQELLGITLAHSDHAVLLIRAIGMLSSLTQKSHNMLYTTELLKGLRHAFIFFHSRGDKDAIHFILRIVYGLEKSNRKQAEAMAESEIASGITECLSQEPEVNTIMMFLTIINGIMGCFQQTFKDIKQLNDPSFHNTLITLFFRPIPEADKESLHELLSFCLMNLTCDKLSSVSMYEHGVIPKMMEFIATPEQYTQTSVRAAINSLANIGIHCTKAKDTMLDSGMHIMMVDMMDGILNSSDPDWSLYCSALRCIQILASGDRAKQNILKTDLMKSVVNVLKREPKVSEVIWRSLTFIAGLSYIAIPDRERFFTKQLFELVASHMKKKKHGKIFGYGCFFFISMSEHDLGVRYTGGLGLDKTIFEAMSNPSLSAEMDDLKRWCTDCLDKFICHIIQRPLSQPNSQAPLPSNSDNFIVHRHFGSTRHSCSNCELEAPRSEVVMRPDAVTLEQYQLLVNNGWYRRGGSKMFRFNSQHRQVCFDWETRVRVNEFDINSSKSFKRVLKKVPKDVVVETVPARLTQEGVDLYNHYHLEKHDKSAKTPDAYAEHAVSSPLRLESRGGIDYGTYHQEYRLNGKLIAIGVIDVILEGVVSVYFFYHMSKEVAKMSLGVYSSLKEIEFIQNLSKKNPAFKYYYLQGWNGPNQKLAYKANYKPIEFCSPCYSPYWTDNIKIPYIQTGFLPPIHEGKIPQELTSIESTRPDLLNETSNNYQSVDIDRAFLREVHKVGIKGSDVRVFLNGDIMRCEELLEKYKVYSETKHCIYETLEELALALGYPLCNQLLVVFKFSEEIQDT